MELDAPFHRFITSAHEDQQEDILDWHPGSARIRDPFASQSQLYLGGNSLAPWPSPLLNASDDIQNSIWINTHDPPVRGDADGSWHQPAIRHAPAAAFRHSLDAAGSFNGTCIEPSDSKFANLGSAPDFAPYVNEHLSSRTSTGSFGLVSTTIKLSSTDHIQLLPIDHILDNPAFDDLSTHITLPRINHVFDYSGTQYIFRSQANAFSAQSTLQVSDAASERGHPLVTMSIPKLPSHTSIMSRGHVPGMSYATTQSGPDMNASVPSGHVLGASIRHRKRARLCPATKRSARSSPWACPFCDFVQATPRAPDLRRHIKAHEQQMKPPQWVCCGVPLEFASSYNVPEGSVSSSFRGREMVGGCWLAFSRRDAYGRHLKRKRGCIGDVGKYANGFFGSEDCGTVQ